MQVLTFTPRSRSMRDTVDALLATMQAVALSMEESARHVERAGRLCDRSRSILWPWPAPWRALPPRDAKVIAPSPAARASKASVPRPRSATLLPFPSRTRDPRS